MSTLTVSAISTANGSSDLTLQTGNALAVFIKEYATGPLTIQNSSANVMFIAANGNVGMGGNVTPVDALSVNGTINATAFSLAGVALGPYTTNVQVFTANGTWNKPSGFTSNDVVEIMMWGGGGGGNTTTGWGGGGGAYMYGLCRSQDVVNATITVGLAGAAGGAGSNSVFVGTITLTACGGGAANTTQSGGGGGTFALGTIGVGGAPLGGALANPGGTSTFGGGGGTSTATAAGGPSVNGGGGGGGTTGAGGQSLYGGGGGSGTTGVSGNSVFGGKGANSSTAAVAPGGGGAGLTNVVGARGEVRIFYHRITTSSVQ